MAGVLSGLKVVDAGSFLAGPCAATILSDYGADVIKVEPRTGDRHRTISAGHPIDHSWQLTGRNKRSLALDITTEQGHEVLMRLLQDADVLVVNFNTSQLEKYGLTLDKLHQINKRLVLAQISGYGLKGPDANRPAFDLTGWFARTGVLDMMHDKDVAPAPPAGGVGDHSTAMTLFGGIMVALFKREQTGEGSMVSTSLAATGAWANGLNLQAVMTGADIAERRDKEGWSNPMTNVYTSSDGRYIVLAVQNAKRDWPVLANTLGHPEWLEDERFSDVRSLFRNRFAAKENLLTAFAELTVAQITERLEASGIVFSLIARNAEVIEDEQLIANGVIVPTESSEPGYDRTLATPFQVSGEPQRTPALAPKIGEHTQSILSEAGYSEATIEQMIADEVAGAAS
jgi:crotonobetainyl-CoA:carnitine CoA-transferase CaiB-like acyl-CoA transferase